MVVNRLISAFRYSNYFRETFGLLIVFKCNYFHTNFRYSLIFRQHANFPSSFCSLVLFGQYNCLRSTRMTMACSAIMLVLFSIILNLNVHNCISRSFNSSCHCHWQIYDNRYQPLILVPLSLHIFQCQGKLLWAPLSTF